MWVRIPDVIEGVEAGMQQIALRGQRG